MCRALKAIYKSLLHDTKIYVYKKNGEMESIMDAGFMFSRFYYCFPFIWLNDYQFLTCKSINQVALVDLKKKTVSPFDKEKNSGEYMNYPPHFYKNENGKIYYFFMGENGDSYLLDTVNLSMKLVKPLKEYLLKDLYMIRRLHFSWLDYRASYYFKSNLISIDSEQPIVANYALKDTKLAIQSGSPFYRDREVFVYDLVAQKAVKLDCEKTVILLDWYEFEE